MAASGVEVAFELKRVVTEYNAAFAAHLRPLGLTTLQAESLIALDDLGPVRLKQLATHLVAESGHPSRLVSRLERDGLATRDGGDDAVLIRLTERGSRLASQSRTIRDRLTAALAEALGTDLEVVQPSLRRGRVRMTRERIAAHH
jgi:DNA-binding MarR family transcriptional regulator